MNRTRRAALIAASALVAATAAAVPIAFATGASAEAACEGAPWRADEIYVGGDLVSHEDQEYRAKWWTTGEEPGTTGQWGVWEPLGACDGADDPTDPTDPPTTDEPTDPPTGDGDATLTGYWHNFDNGSGTMHLSEVPEEYDIIAVAFAEAVASPTGAVDFALDPVLNYAEADFKADIAAIQAEGRKVIISVGGERGNVIVNDTASANAFADSILSLMDEYGFDGVDIDLEHGINAAALETAMRRIHASAGSSLVYTMAPQTIEFQYTSGGYRDLAVNTKDILTIVNMQYYNSGTMLGCDDQVYGQGDVDFITAQACIQLEAGLDPSQVGLGLPAVPSAASSGYVDPSMVNDALDCLSRLVNCGDFTPDQAYPGIGGAMTWSINWDATSGYHFANTVAGHFATLP
ncbi:glycosyl hydrolase family 18 protein [Glycomyces arizonensis]|uniref:glycosyl hydrolase family 18 protein n=1 Tax=Glycomyces arizonensis TaxID=256035 RepID=UPI00047ABD0A|nr:glycosyl hydrolase family 18 protein [Glycomyces arizonensis]